MRKLLIFLSAAIMVITGACSKEKPAAFVLVKGGAFINTKSGYYGTNVTVSDFYIGTFEVTQREWIEVRGDNPSQFKANDLPVETVSWYDCIEYCNQRSVKEGLDPYYNIDKNKKDPNNFNSADDVKWTVTINAGANGYRLPTEAEWEYAAGGGQISNNYAFSGSDDINETGWYYQTETKFVGGKKPNELGLYDMSGNIREWCWDWYGDRESNAADPKGRDGGSLRVWKGGGWIGLGMENSFRGSFEANSKAPDQGFRLCRGL